MTDLTKDRRTRATRRENAKRHAKRRPAFTKAASTALAYKRLAPGTLTNLIAKED